MRLEIEDIFFDIGGSGDGFYFKILCSLFRDIKVYILLREVARKLKERSRMFNKLLLFYLSLRSGSVSLSVRIFFFVV